MLSGRFHSRRWHGPDLRFHVDFRPSRAIDFARARRCQNANFGGDPLHFRDARQIGIMNRVGMAGRFLAKPRQRPSPRDLSLATRTIRAPISASFSAATSPMPEVPPATTTVFPFMKNSPAPYRALPLGPGSAGFRSLRQRATVWRKPIDAGFAHGAGAWDPRVRDERRAGELLPYIVDQWIEGLP
jgi:hypothetical protein